MTTSVFLKNRRPCPLAWQGPEPELTMVLIIHLSWAELNKSVCTDRRR